MWAVSSSWGTRGYQHHCSCQQLRLCILHTVSMVYCLSTLDVIYKQLPVVCNAERLQTCSSVYKGTGQRISSPGTLLPACS